MDINIVLIISATLIYLTTIYYLEEHSLAEIGIDRMKKQSFGYHSIIILIIVIVLMYMSNPLFNTFVNTSYASSNIMNVVSNLFE